jgi:hypothetical protein
MNIEILSREVIIARIGSIRTSATELASQVHEVAYNSLLHCKEHGDVSLLESLLNALPQRSGMRAEALAEWFRKVSTKAIRIAKDGEVWTAKCSGHKPEDFDLVLAESTSPFMLTKEKAPGKTFTVDMLLKKLRTWATETETNEDGTPKVDPTVRALASRLLTDATKG